MAYNSGYNPDALPAHAEPEQAAQILSSQQQQQEEPQQQPPPPNNPRRYSNPPRRPYANSNPAQPQPHHPYQNKPPPPLPGQPSLQPPSSTHPPPSSGPPSSYNSRITPPPQNYGPGPPPQNYNQGQPPHQHAHHSPPPPQNYGHGPRPPPEQHNRPTPPSRPPGTPAPPSSSNDASLFPLFKMVDQNGKGQLTERELGRALVNGDFTQFDGHTVRMMIRMFDSDKDGSVNFEEFCGLWSFLAAWRALFDRFDEDKSGSISPNEYTNALVAFGYRLSATFIQMLYSTYDKSGEGKMSFDLFVQSCIILKRMTDVFKKYDEDRDGYITLSFEEFLTEILRQR